MNMPLAREFHLSSVAGQGVRCDADGAFVGDVTLLRRVGNEWAPRGSEELSAALSKTYGLPVDASAKEKGLATIARALNEGEVARAQLATLFAHFPDPPSLAKRVPSRDEIIKLALALDWAGLLKIDTNHYPAHAPDDKGGEFAPKNSSPLETFAAEGGEPDLTNVREVLAANAQKAPSSLEPPQQADDFDSLVGDRDSAGGAPSSLSEAAEETATRAGKDVAKSVIRKALQRAVRKAGLYALKNSYKLILDEVPLVDIISGVSTARDIFKLGKDFSDIQISTRAAKEFVDLGQRRIEDLFVDDQSISFKDFKALKKAELQMPPVLEKYYGPAGPGQDYHHIIEQNSGLPESIINNTHNVVRIPRLFHQEIDSIYYTESARWGGQTLHAWLKGKTPWVQYYWGRRIMRELGIVR